MENLFKWLKSWMPVSHSRHELELRKVLDDKAQALANLRREHERKIQETTAAVQRLVDRLSVIDWRPEPYGGYVMQLRVSDQMMRYSTVDERERSMVAEALGHRVAAEIRASKFIQ